MKKSLIVLTVVLIVLVLDQTLKIWVKTHFCYGEDRPLFGLNWARLNFVENPGMAFGWKFGGDYGKLALSLFRLVAIGFLIYYISKLVRRIDVSVGLLVSFSLILAGALGNIIDSAFYGLIFSESSYHCISGPAQLFPPEGGYGTFLHGKVVDMLFFPMWKSADGDVKFFQPVFNVADSAITVGVVSILIFQRRFFTHSENKSITENIDNQSFAAENAVDTEGSENFEKGEPLPPKLDSL